MNEFVHFFCKQGLIHFNLFVLIDFIDFGTPAQLSYRPDAPRRISHLIDFAISKNVNRYLVTAEITFDLSSDYSPVIATYYGRISLARTSTKVFYKTNLLKYI